MKSMETLEHPTTIQEAIERVCEFGRGYEIECRPRCDDVSDTWIFRDGKILGPQDGAPVEFSNEQWINKCMEKLYDCLGIIKIQESSYYRFTAEKKEYDDGKLGNFRRSYNHRGCDFKTHTNCIPEPGKSVAIGPLFTYFVDHPYAFLIQGDVAETRCSDGSPLLKINDNLKITSNIMTVPELLTEFYRINEGIFISTSNNSGISEVDLFNLLIGIWDNYKPL